jgi:3-oxoacyl-[acyl-carrier protein] reductase
VTQDLRSDFTGRSGAAVVSGGTGGLGAAVARLLVARGSRVGVLYRSNRAAADVLVQELAGAGGEVHALPADLTDPVAAADATARMSERFGGVHTVVYASGPHVPMVHLSRVDASDFRRQVEQDVLAFFNLVVPALPHLRESRGSIVAVTTAATTRFPVRDGLSSVPKGAVDAMVRALAREEGRFGVRANCVGPGMLTDGMAERLISSGDLDERALEAARVNIPMHTFGTASDIAEAVCFLASDRAGFISGQKLDVDGGYGV